MDSVIFESDCLYHTSVNVGCNLNKIDGIVKSLSIPVYTIGYNANLDELGQLSAINEAATINADSEDVVYKLGSLFNAQM